MKKCPNCGRASSIITETISECDAGLESSIYDCPLCGDSESVQKVSAVVAEGTMNSSSVSNTSGRIIAYKAFSLERQGRGYVSGTTKTTNVRQNRLAAKLSPHRKPNFVRRLDFWYFAFHNRPGQIMTCIVIFIFIIFCVQSAPLNATYNRYTTYYATMFFVGLGIAILSMIFSGAIVYRFLKEEYSTRRIQYENDMKIYQKAMEQWQNLYYCEKHDIVFVTGKKKYAPSDQTWQACVQWGKEALEKSNI